MIFFKWDTNQHLEKMLADTITVRQSMRDFIALYQRGEAEPDQARLIAAYTRDICDINREFIKREAK